MFALLVGDAVTRNSSIPDVTEKSGRTGSLAFVKLRHEVSRNGRAGVAIAELHDIVYREPPRADDAPPSPQAASASSSRALSTGRCARLRNLPSTDALIVTR